MLKRSSVPDSSVDFWNLLTAFWSDDRIQEWHNVLFPNQNDPNKGVETCCNLMGLSPDAHTYWTKAYFALQPIELSDDKKRLDVKFHWMLRRSEYSHKVDVLTPPSSLEDLDGGSDIKLFHFPTDQRIRSGDMISLTTDDPVTRPLPHYGLLEMQWILQRVVAMSGAAEIYDDFNNDDDDTMALRDEWDPYREDEWDSYGEDEWDSYLEDENGNSYEEESPPSMVHQPSPPLRPPSLSPFLKSNIRSDYMPLRPAENLDIKMIGSSQGQ
jgi:HNH endonuclease